MVIDEIDLAGVSVLEPEDNAPVSGHRYGPEARKVALERMQTKALEVYIADLRRLFQASENPRDLGRSGDTPFRSPVSNRRLRPLWRKLTIMVKCNPPPLRLQSAL